MKEINELNELTYLTSKVIYDKIKDNNTTKNSVKSDIKFLRDKLLILSKALQDSEFGE